MEIGDKVYLTKKAIEEFYGTEKNIESYSIAGDMDVINFMRYVEDQQAFENGKNPGTIYRFSPQRDGSVNALVVYNTFLGQRGHYYNTKDLISCLYDL